MTLRSFGSRPESDLEKAEATAAAFRSFLSKLAATNISFGKAVSGSHEPCFPALYQDIDIRVREGEPEQGMVFDFTLRSHADGCNPGKNGRFYDEFKNIIETFQQSGSVMVYGPLLNGMVAEGDGRPVVAYSLTHAESDALADKVGEWTSRLNERARTKASWNEASRF